MLDAAEADRRYTLLLDYADGAAALLDVAEEVHTWTLPDPAPADEGTVWGLAEMTPADAPEGFALVRSAFDYGIITAEQYEALQVELDVIDEELGG